MLGGVGCDALDPVETESLCAEKSGVISRNCGACQEPPFAPTCPQCQGKAGIDPRCRNAPDASGLGQSDAAQDAAGAVDARTLDGAGDATTFSEGGTADAAADSGGDSSLDAGPDASALDAAADSATPCGPCSGTADLCDRDAMTCVECLTSENCDGDDVCSDTGTCEQCNVDADCKAAAPRCVSHACVACTGSDTSCDDRSTTPVCDTDADSDKHGQCVACTDTSHTLCGAAPDTTSYVCNSLDRTCTSIKERSAGDCAPCVSDAQCQVGQVCANQEFGDPAERTGWFCYWIRSASGAGPNGNCDNVKPAVKSQTGVVSIDGTTVEACVPRTTTCAALNDVGKACGTSGTSGTANHALCGYTHAEESYTTHEDQDGYCVDTDGSAGTNWKCTVSCVDAKDCKSVFTCETIPTPDLCSL